MALTKQTLEIKHGDYKGFAFNLTQGGSPYPVTTKKVMFRAVNSYGEIVKSSDVVTEIEKTGESAVTLHIEASDTSDFPNVDMDLDFDMQVVDGTRPITVAEGTFRISREFATGT